MVDQPRVAQLELEIGIQPDAKDVLIRYETG